MKFMVLRQLALPTKLVFLLLLVTGVIVAGYLALNNDSVSAANKNDWITENIISDANFTDTTAMSVSQIQSFLDKQIGSCDVWGTGRAVEFGSRLTRAQYAKSRGWPAPPYVCLNKYYEVPKKTPTSGKPVNNFNKTASRPSGSRSAAWIIKDAANRYKISPKVLLVKIATESAGPLTSDKWPLESQYRYAMGSNCPDSGPGGSANCNDSYAGFSIQMYSAAGLMRSYLDNMDEPWWSLKRPGKGVVRNGINSNYVGWNVAPTGCGGTNLNIRNKATAALYTYTPYQPNAAALNNLYGTGDRCSAYGNRNFWRVYTDWFGSTRKLEFMPANQPRWMTLKSDLRKKNLSNGLDTGPTLRAGTEIFFSEKILVNGELYLRTRHDSTYGQNTGVLYSELGEIARPFETMNAPRWMTLTRSVRKQNPVTEAISGSSIPKGLTVYFTDKYEIGGTLYLRSDHDSTNTVDRGISFDDLAEANVSVTEMNLPRWLEVATSTNPIDTVKGNRTDKKLWGGSHIYYTHKFMIDDKLYLRTTPGADSADFVGVAYEELTELPDGFLPLSVPRDFRLVRSTQKINTDSSAPVGGTLDASRVISFSSKIYIGDKMYLRTDHDTTHGYSRAIPYEDLESL